MKRRITWLFWISVALRLREHGVLALSSVVEVESDQDECYRFRTPPSWKKDIKSNPRFMFGSYELMNHGETTSAGPLSVFLATDNMKERLYKSSEGESSGHFDVQLEADKVYWFCIANRVSASDDDDDDFQDHDHHISVGFSIELVTFLDTDFADSVGDNPADVDETTKAHQEAKDRAFNWLKVGSTLRQRLKELTHHFDYLRVREMKHRAVTERTFTDVLTWTVAEAATVALVALVQIFFFRIYLERRKTVLG